MGVRNPSTTALLRTAFSSGICSFALTLSFSAVAFAEKQTLPVVAEKPVLDWKPSASNALREAKPVVLGGPAVADATIRFDGVDDALIFPVNPLQGLARFTIEMLIRPDRDGSPEQRFFHLQDKLGRRVLLELRLEKESGSWALDTFLHASPDSKLTLLDRAKKHPAAQWTWVSLTYDGATMKHYVRGEQEMEGPVVFPAMGEGEASLGVRLNRVNWFKGEIRQIRIFPSALPAEMIRAHARQGL